MLHIIITFYNIITENFPNSYYEKFTDGKVVCIDEEIPYEIPPSWEWCRLGQLCTVFGRIGFRGYTKADMVQEGKGAISISPSNMNEDGSMGFELQDGIFKAFVDKARKNFEDSQKSKEAREQEVSAKAIMA